MAGSAFLDKPLLGRVRVKELCWLWSGWAGRRWRCLTVGRTRSLCHRGNSLKGSTLRAARWMPPASLWKHVRVVPRPADVLKVPLVVLAAGGVFSCAAVIPWVVDPLVTKQALQLPLSGHVIRDQRNPGQILELGRLKAVCPILLLVAEVFHPLLVLRGTEMVLVGDLPAQIAAHRPVEAHRLPSRGVH